MQARWSPLNQTNVKVTFTGGLYLEQKSGQSSSYFLLRDSFLKYKLAGFVNVFMQGRCLLSHLPQVDEEEVFRSS